MKMDFMFITTGGGPGVEAFPADAVGEPLARLPRGASGRVVSVDVSAPDRERLEVMGLCQGRIVQVVQPGDPMIVRVLGTRIGLAGALAEGVRVQPEAPLPGSTATSSTSVGCTTP